MYVTKFKVFVIEKEKVQLYKCEFVNRTVLLQKEKRPRD